MPPSFRRSSEVPPILVLHKARLATDEVIRERGYSVTTPMRAILDLTVSGKADRDVITQALREGRNRGLVTRKQIAATRARADIPVWLLKSLEERP